jgi:hypothetical protein
VIARTSLIIGDGDSGHERQVHALSTGEPIGVLFTDDVRCPVHVADLAAALLELPSSEPVGPRSPRADGRIPVGPGHSMFAWTAPSPSNADAPGSAAPANS